MQLPEESFVRQLCRVSPPAHISPVLWHAGVPLPPPRVAAEPLHPAMAPARASAAEETVAQTVTFIPPAYVVWRPGLPSNGRTAYSPSMGETAGRIAATGLAASALGSQRAIWAPDRSMMRSQPSTRMNW